MKLIACEIANDFQWYGMEKRVLLQGPFAPAWSDLYQPRFVAGQVINLLSYQSFMFR
jgi:hypothetical protein